MALEGQIDNEFFAAASVNNVIAVLWRRTTVAGIAVLQEHIERFGAQHPNGFAILTMVPEHSSPPDSEARRKLATVMERGGTMRAVALYFEGTGVRVTVIRSVTTGLMLLARPPYPYKVFDTLEGALTFLTQALEKSGSPSTPTAALLGAFLPWRRATAVR